MILCKIIFYGIASGWCTSLVEYKIQLFNYNKKTIFSLCEIYHFLLHLLLFRPMKQIIHICLLHFNLTCFEVWVFKMCRVMLNSQATYNLPITKTYKEMKYSLKVWSVFLIIWLHVCYCWKVIIMHVKLSAMGFINLDSLLKTIHEDRLKSEMKLKPIQL